MSEADYELDQMQIADDLADTTNDLALALSRIHELEQGIREAAEWCHSDLPHTAGCVLTALLVPS